MPQSATVIPGGGGDYLTIQAWEDAVDGTALDEKTALCTGDVGPLNLFGWTSTPDASNNAIITHNSDLHDGTEAGMLAAARGRETAASFTWLIQEPYVVIDGMGLDKSNTDATPALEYRAAADNCTLRNSFVVQNGAVNEACMDVDSGVTGFVCENTIFLMDNGTTATTAALDHAATGGTYTNCTFHRKNTASTCRGIGGGGSATFYSCAVMGFSDNWYTGTWSGNYNIQDDADAGMPGANSTDNATIPTAFGSRDYNLVSGDDLIDAGDPLNSAATDYAGISRSTPDCGASEFVAAGGTTRNYLTLMGCS